MTMWDKIDFDSNTYNYISQTKMPDTITVNEHRAPTDDSVKLLEEMKEKALQHIIWHDANIGVKDNCINYSFDVIDVAPGANNRLFSRKLIIVSAKINGKQYQIKKYLDELVKDFKYDPTSYDNIYNIIELRIEMLGQLIAESIIDNTDNSELFRILK